MDREALEKRKKIVYEFICDDLYVPMKAKEIAMILQVSKEQREELHRLKNVEPMEIINESYEADYHFEKEEGHLTHHIGVLTTEETAGEGLELIPVPEASWAMLIARSGFR